MIPRQDVTITECTYGTYIDGLWIPGTEQTPYVIQASIQPLTPEERKILPEGKRASGESYILITDINVNLIIANEGSQSTCKVDVWGEDFEPISVDIWNNNLIPHKEYTITKKTIK